MKNGLDNSDFNVNGGSYLTTTFLSLTSNTGALGERTVGYSLSLDGTIGFNFFMDLPKEVVKDQSAYVLFTLPEGRTQKQYVKDAIKVNEKYQFTCRTYAMEMTDKVDIQLFNGKGNAGKNYQYSVYDYANALINSNGSDNEKKLIKSMLNYGGYAQDLFNYNLRDMAYKNVKNELENEMVSLNANMLEKYKAVALSKSDDASARGVTLETRSATTLRIYFEIPDISKIDSSSIMIDGQKQTLKQNSKGNYLEVENINSNSLDKFYTFTIGGTSIKACALSYAYSAIEYNIAPEFAKSLYLYFKESKAYFG